MKTVLPKQLNTQAEVENFISNLYANGEFFHLDDDASEIVNRNDERLFTDEEANQINSLLQQAFEICDVWELPIISKVLENVTDNG